MKNTYLSTALVVSAFVAQAEAHAKAGPVTCPLEIQQSSIKVSANPGWVPHVTFPLRLYSAGMSGGAPGSLLVLRGQPQPAKKGVYKTLYDFSAGDEKWLDCDYGDAGEISMSRRLDDGLTQCVITILPDIPAKPRRLTVECR